MTVLPIVREVEMNLSPPLQLTQISFTRFFRTISLLV
nr:MAG TPA: hypothetical protein [Caudoviricetes sp.]